MKWEVRSTKSLKGRFLIKLHILSARKTPYFYPLTSYLLLSKENDKMNLPISVILSLRSLLVIFASHFFSWKN
jgi:hypothetical protein